MITEEAIFEAAAARPASERSAYLDAACAGRPAVRARVEALLGAHDATGFMEGGQVTTRLPGLDAEWMRVKPEEPGQQIGPYTLLEPIGEGGFGVVWVAEQVEPVRRRVALKIVKAGMDSREIIARFDQERQALAVMNHPNIAKVLDAGVTANGRPFFVMELVRGLKITDACDQANLPTAERLRLFITVCQAVQHAHQKGIIHRDLKPSNILVTPGDDGRPVPKVIDFGVAKAIQQPLTDTTIHTQFEQMIGTPAYMSPEQTGWGPTDVDTRSDVYSLGAVLYELLTGRPPFASKDLMSAGLDEMRRVIREVDPPRPSTCLSTIEKAHLTRLSQSHHTAVPKLISAVRGDLDWIVMKALEKDRARRYESAADLAADVERRWRNEPVVAGPPGLAYRGGKFVRKHKAAVMAAAAVMVTLLGGLAVSIAAWQSEKTALAAASIQRQNAEASRKAALAESEKSAQTADFLEKMLAGLSPAEIRGRNIDLLKRVLDDSAKDMNSRVTDQPEVEATLHLILGRAYQRLGLAPEARRHHELALDFYGRSLGPADPTTQAVRNALGAMVPARDEPDGAASSAGQASPRPSP